MDTTQCTAGLFCADGVCCTSPCNQGRYDLPPNVGTCTNVAAPAPTMSSTGLWLAVAALLAIAAAAFWRRRRFER